jgi:hypothetical protein
LKIIPGDDDNDDQFALIPLFSGSAKFWGCIYNPFDKFVYFFPGSALNTTRLDIITESYDKIGEPYGGSKWTSRPITLTNGETYVLPSRDARDVLKLQVDKSKLFYTEWNNQGLYKTGQDVDNDYKLRPFIVSHLGKSYVLFHNGGNYGIYDPNADNVEENVPLIKGPSLPNGVTGLVDNDTFVSLYRATCHIVDLFQGGVSGWKSPIDNADLALTVQEPDLISFVGDTELRTRNVFRTVFGNGSKGIFATLASDSNTLLTFINEQAVRRTDQPYVSNGTVDGFFNVGRVAGFQDLQLTCPNDTRVDAVGSSSENAVDHPLDNLFDSNTSSFWRPLTPLYNSTTGLPDNANAKDYVTLTLTEPMRIGSFALVPPTSDMSTMPASLSLHASTDGGVTWDVKIQDFSKEKIEYQQYEREVFTITTCGYYTHYKLQIDAVFPSASTVELSSWVVFGRFQQTGNPGSTRSVFSGYISEIVAFTRTDQQDASLGADQVFYYNYSSSPYIDANNNSTRQ